MCLDAVEDMWQNCELPKFFRLAFTSKLPIQTRHLIGRVVIMLTKASPFSDDDAKIPTTKILAKWRPSALLKDEKPPAETNGVKQHEPEPPGGVDSSLPSQNPPVLGTAPSKNPTADTSQISPIAAAG